MTFEIPTRTFQQRHIDMHLAHAVRELGDLCRLLVISEPENRWFYKGLHPLYDQLRWAEIHFNLHEYFVYQAFLHWAERADSA